jgi:hypothetical protein
VRKQPYTKGKYTVVAVCQQNFIYAGHWWLTPIILASQEAEIRRIVVQSQPGQIACNTLPISKKPITKIGLVEWLKV